MIKKYFFVTLLLFANLFSIDLKDLARDYIEYGQEKIVNDLNSLIRKTSFWRHYIDDIDVTYGYFGYKNHLILTSKAKKRIDIFEIKNKNPRLYKSIPAIFGSIDGDKQIEGDKKTPIGLYDFLARLDRGKSKLADKYGPLALVTTYPNLMDKLIYKKTGHGIWLHGKPYKKNNKVDTLGCVAINNSELSKLGKLLDYKKTMLIISKDKYAKASKNEIASILSSFYTWKYYWQTNDFENYMSFYDPDFRRYDNKNLDEFRAFKKAVFAKSKEQRKEIIFTKINIIPYIEGSGQKLFKISFFEKYISNGYKFEGDKNLYISFVNNKINILIEE